MKEIKILLCVVLHSILAKLAAALPDRIPIGAIFDHDSIQIHTAFRFAIVQQNGNDSQPRIKLDAAVEFVDITDSFRLTSAICTQMNRGIFAMFGVNNATSVNTALAYSNAFHMPFITPSRVDIDPEKTSNFGVQMLPSFTKAIADVIASKHWTHYYYLYDTDEALERIQEINKALYAMNNYVQVDMRRISNFDRAGEQLKQMLAGKKKDTEKRFVLDFSKKRNMQKMLDKVAEIRMNKRDYHYIIANLGIQELNLKKLLNGGVNITGLQLMDTDNKTVQVFVSAWEELSPTTWPGAGVKDKGIEYQAALAYDSVSVFAKAVTKLAHKRPEIFRNQFTSRIRPNGSSGLQCRTKPLSPYGFGTAIQEAIMETEHHGLTGYIAFDNYGRRRNYTLGVWELGFKRKLKKIGTWTPPGGLAVVIQGRINAKKERMYDPEVTRKVTSILTPPFLMIQDSASKDGVPPIGNKRFQGYSLDLTKAVARKMDVEYKIEPVKDEKYGAYVKSNDSWNGMIGEIIRGEADMAVAPLTITSDRENVVDFSKPFMSLGISIMIKTPDKENPGVFSFMDPLSYEIWMCIVFAYIGVSVVLFLVSRFSPYEWHIDESSGSPTAKNDFTIFNSLWFILAAFMQQGCEISPRSFSGRIVGSVWWFFTFIIISSYTANLAAFLTVERMSSTISGAEDLAKQTKIKYGTVNAGSTKSFFGKSQIPTFRRMWTFMRSNEDVFTATTIEGVNRVRNSNGKYAFLLESTMNEYYNQQEPCNTMKVGDNLDSKGYGIATPFNSELSVAITLAVLELKENGDLHGLEQKWWMKRGQCGDPKAGAKGELQNALDLTNVAGIFLILIGGLVVASFTSVLELMYRAKVEAKRKKISFWKSLKSKVYITCHGELDANNDPLASEIAHHYKPMSTHQHQHQQYSPSSSKISNIDGYTYHRAPVREVDAHTQV